MTARTATVQNILLQPGTSAPMVGAVVTFELNTAGFSNGGANETVGTAYATTDATGLWSKTLVINDDVDPAGTYWYVTEPIAGRRSIQLVAANAGQTVNMRDVLVTNPVNPNPVVFTQIVLQGNLDGGAPDSVYTTSQVLDGGTP